MPSASSCNKRRASVFTIPDGTFVTKRSGAKLCRAWQQGTCRVGKPGVCPVDPNLCHQCAKCLSSSHGLAAWKGEFAEPPPAFRQNKDKSKGPDQN
eukprot:4795417-Amphidinium_carterae.1